MTKDEAKALERLEGLLIAINKGNELFKQQVSDLVSQINTKVEHKHAPITLEENILSTVQQSISTAIAESLKGYNSPLLKLVNEVVSSRQQQLREVITSAFDEVISTKDFRDTIVSAFSHKVSRTIISNNDGLFDKVSNELKADPIFKSKMVLAVANVVEQCLTENK